MTDPEEALPAAPLAVPSHALERRMAALFSEATVAAERRRPSPAVGLSFILFGAAAAALTLALMPTDAPLTTARYELQATPAMTSLLSDIPASDSPPRLSPFVVTSPLLPSP